ncbi:DUF6241 domain-containing protein [Mesobacillus zeae]|uniref:PRK06770 family protein n=1 Tax=Mesobacillus zeae TaxID=1917180 RepID=A0A398AUS8_9BACI|nr:DUF6241 domain-containing protein [Mesobacillus zeae]RID81479.1 hypothetical protein D1970_21710 [Mesobacillus zeae]
MKTILKWIWAIVFILIAAGIGTYAVVKNVVKYDEKQVQEKSADIDTPKEVDSDIPKEITKEVIAEQTAAIGGIQYDLEISENPTQEEIVVIMHKMTHQKVMAEDKWGAIPMTPDTINKVLEAVNANNFTIKADLLRILEKWKRSDFDTIDLDHNYFWEHQGGTVGKAYGKLNSSEEADFIKNNFQAEQ